MTALRKPVTTQGAPAYDVERIRSDFPILGLEVNGHPLVYLDNAASSQMPRQVIDALVRYQTTQHANVNRGVHYLSETATFEYEEARRKVQRFINSRETSRIDGTSCTICNHGTAMAEWCQKKSPAACAAGLFFDPIDRFG